MNRWFHKVPNQLMKDVPSEYITWLEGDLICRKCHKVEFNVIYANHIEHRYCKHCESFQSYDQVPDHSPLIPPVDGPDQEEDDSEDDGEPI
jgi:late competence protein required for DNA uptake (superfamily II DNA/RNA helicase)